MKSLKKVFSDVAQDPATFIALGSVFMSAANGGVEGIFANALATAVIASLKARESWTGKEKGMPFGTLALVNFTTALSIGLRAIDDNSLDPDSLKRLSMALAYTFWGVRSTLLSLHERKGKKRPNGTVDDPQFYQGIGALLTTRGMVVPAILSVLGISRTLMNKKLDRDTKNGKAPGFIRRHFTAANAYSAQYAVSAFLAIGLLDLAAFASWSWAFSRFGPNEKKKNLGRGANKDAQLGPSQEAYA